MICLTLSIYFDKLFKIGDFIVIGDKMGTVKNIGIKTTRIQTLQGEELVVTNTELALLRFTIMVKWRKEEYLFL